MHTLLGLGGPFIVLAIVGCRLSWSQAAGTKTFENKKYSYTIDYPSDWYLRVLEDRFAIESFPPSKGTRGSGLGDGGAAIIVVVPQEVAQSRSDVPQDLEDWVRIGTKYEEVTSRRKVGVETSGGRTPAIEVKTICCAVPPFQETVEWYFRIDNKYFLAILIHWRNDPEVQAREETLKRVVRSLRVVRAVNAN